MLGPVGTLTHALNSNDMAQRDVRSRRFMAGNIWVG